jgi:hypothetical protein
MYPCKWNHTSSEKNVNCGSISPSTADCRNQLQETSTASWIVQLQGVHELLFFYWVLASAIVLPFLH